MRHDNWGPVLAAVALEIIGEPTRSTLRRLTGDTAGKGNLAAHVEGRHSPRSQDR